jgi:hypothetical protein
VKLRPISIKVAKRVVRDWHRHLDAPQGARFALSAWKDGQLVGVALVGNPIARLTMLKGQTEDKPAIEVIRVATDGTHNACSFLYSRAKRAAQALGYVRVLTKTLPEESGASLRAVGATFKGECRAQQWDRENRHRSEKPMTAKLRWDLTA